MQYNKLNHLNQMASSYILVRYHKNIFIKLPATTVSGRHATGISAVCKVALLYLQRDNAIGICGNFMCNLIKCWSCDQVWTHLLVSWLANMSIFWDRRAWFKFWHCHSDQYEHFINPVLAIVITMPLHVTIIWPQWQCTNFRDKY